MTNVGKWLSRFLLVAVAAASVSACVQQDEKKDETPAPPPAAPPPEPARASLAIDPKVSYAVVTGSNKCLQFGGGSKADVAQAEIASCNGSPAQQFKLQAIPGGYYAVVSVNSDKCLDVSAFAMGDAAKLQQSRATAARTRTGSWPTAARGRSGWWPATAARSWRSPARVPRTARWSARRSWTSAPNQQFKLKGPAAIAADGPAAKGDASGAGGARARRRRAASTPTQKRRRPPLSRFPIRW